MAYKFEVREDEDSAPGWSIGDTQHFVKPGETQWTRVADTIWGFEVEGAELSPLPLVSNRGQTAAGVGLTFVTTIPKHAQAFTSGGNAGGYPLRSIEIRFHTLSMPSTDGGALVVSLNADDNGDPGAALCTLSDPPSFRASGSHKFSAPPSCPALAANTTYFVVIESLDTAATRSLSVTSSPNEDSAAAGWSVADQGRRLERGTWKPVSSGSLMIAVNGEIAPPPSAPVVFSYTVEPTDESGPDGIAVGDPDSDGNTIALGGGTITIRRSGETFPLDYTALFADAEHLVNWARPRLVSAATSKDGKRVRLTFSEDLGRSGRPPTSLFTLKVDGAEAALTGIGIDAAVVDSETWTVDAPLETPQNWAFTPSGLSAGDQFRLLFLTSTTRDATSSEIDDYNSFVQTAAAAGDAGIQGYSDGFYAVASTGDDDARDNTQTTYTASDKGVPIYWLGGNKLADDYEDFYDGVWDDENNVTDESGEAYTGIFPIYKVWTGSDDDGVSRPDRLGASTALGSSGPGGAAIGAINVPASEAMGDTVPNPIFWSESNRTSVSLPLYALSLPFVVSEAAVEPPAADETQLVGSVVTLELVTPLTSADQVVTVSYDDPRLGDDSNVIEDLVGNDARSFTNRPVVNRFAFAPPAVEVPADWPLIPEGLPAGAPFRLLFVTSSARDATSAYIEDYDDFVQNAAAAGHDSIREYRDGFLALVSTAETDARDNTSTTGAGVPIYWLGGAKAADNYADFYDGSWDDENRPRDESGAPRRVSALAEYPWTGSDHDGTEAGGGGLPGLQPQPAREPDPPPASTLQAEVAIDWSLKPAGLQAGDRFRLIFLSSAQRDATSTDIGVYNSFVQSLATAGHSAIQAYASQFRAVACTGAVDAVDNTMTQGTGVPIYWLGGAKAADDYADFYDGDWDEEDTVRNQAGGSVSIPLTAVGGKVWTGCEHDGSQGTHLRTNASLVLGAASPIIGHLNHDGTIDGGFGPLNAGDDDEPASRLYKLYALSPVFVVEPPTRVVPSDWELKPDGLAAGDRFRLIFLSSTQRDGSSTEIGVYNQFVQDAAAAGHSAIQVNASQFRAVACTAAVDAVDNTGTSGTGVPIYWLGGNKAADDYADFYDGDWDEEATVRNQAGGSVSIPLTAVGGKVWTGCEHDGSQGTHLRTNASLVLGAASPIIGHLNHDGTIDGGFGPLNAGDDDEPASRSYRLYGLSPIYRVGEPIVVAGSSDGISRGLGGASGEAAYGAPGVGGAGPLSGGAAARSDARPLYAVSQVFVVEPLAVPTGSAIIPDGLRDGDRFRLLFLSSGARNAEATGIDVYNEFVQAAAAAGHTGIQGFSDGFRAVGSTAQIDARENTWMRTEGVPIYWLGGDQLADDYADFYDGSWDDETGATDETGSPRGISTDADSPWTGSNHDGTEEVSSNGSHGLGGGASTGTVVGQLNAEVPGDGPLDADLKERSESRPLYGISPVLVVRDIQDSPPAAPTGLMAEPGDEQVLLRWTRPASDGGRAITRYEYEQNGSGIWISTGSTATSHRVIGLNNSQEYTFRVRAANSIGSGAASGPAGPVTPATKPAAPAGLTATVQGSGEVKLTLDRARVGRRRDDHPLRVRAERFR